MRKIERTERTSPSTASASVSSRAANQLLGTKGRAMFFLLRTAFWLLTDEKYKSALAQFLKKKGEDVYTVDDPKRPPSFSQEKPNTYVQEPVVFPFDREHWRQVVRNVSARFNAHPELFDSDVHITADKVKRLFVSTEGSRIVTEETLYGVHVTAVTRADDGQLLDDSRDFYSPTEAGLPDEAKLNDYADKVITELLALRKAPAIDPYTGPAILAPEAAGVLFHEAVGHRLEGHRQGDDREGKTFRGQEGKQVLPGFLSIYDDPSIRTVLGEPVNGYYLFDEEGVKAQRVALRIQGQGQRLRPVLSLLPLFPMEEQRRKRASLPALPACSQQQDCWQIRRFQQEQPLLPL